MLCSIVLCSFSCDKKTGMEAGVREEEILKQFNVENDKKFNDYLVKKEIYTTRGHLFQDKYHKHLIDIVGDVINNKKLLIKKGTVGFYYDKKSKNTARLYLGLDIDSKKTFAASYSSESIGLLKNDLKIIIETVFSCKSVFLEEDIVGVVIGWYWNKNGTSQFLNIWMSERDLLKFEKNSLTFNELLTRSTVTNTMGRIIRLPL